MVPDFKVTNMMWKAIACWCQLLSITKMLIYIVVF